MISEGPDLRRVGRFTCCNVSLVGGGTVIQIVPSVPLAANTPYWVEITTGIQGMNGVALPGGQRYPAFTTGAGPDTVWPAEQGLERPGRV